MVAAERVDTFVNGAIQGDGTDTVQLSDRDGKVVMHFERPVAWVALDPATAGALAEAMAQAAYKCYSGDVPDPQKKQITERLRIKATNRVEMMLRSMAGESPMPDFKLQATRVVDAIFKEVT